MLTYHWPFYGGRPANKAFNNFQQLSLSEKTRNETKTKNFIRPIFVKPKEDSTIKWNYITPN